VQIGEATNRRYLDALAQVKPTGHSLAQLDSLCHQRVLAGRHYARFNPVCRADSELFGAVLSGAHLITGLRNRDIQQQLWRASATTATEARRRCRRVCRLISKLRGTACWPRSPDNAATASHSSVDGFSPQPSTIGSATFLMPAPLEESPVCGHSGRVNH
jgi:hypothetical protein